MRKATISKMKHFNVLCLVTLQLSVGLKASKNSFSHEIVSRVSQTLQHASKSVSSSSMQSFAALAICSSITCGLACPTPSYASSGLVASSLFEKAETAIDINLQDFKNLEKEWAIGKKIVSDNQALLLKASTSLSTVSKQMTVLEATISNMIDEDSIATKEIRDEIALLRESTGLKYAAAESSSAALAKPAVTAQLFLSAQREAALLEQSENSFKKFVEAIGPAGNSNLLKFYSAHVRYSARRVDCRRTLPGSDFVYSSSFISFFFIFCPVLSI